MPKSKTSSRALPFTEKEVSLLTRSCLMALKPYVPGRSLEEVQEQYKPPRIVKLGSNENPLGANPRILKAIAKALPEIALYPDASSRLLRKTIADFNGVSPDQVMVGNGSDEVLLMLALAFLNPADKICLSNHTFSEYEFSGTVVNAAIQRVPLKDLRYDLPGFAKTLSQKPRMIFLCNPNNPTGNYFTHSELEKLLNLTPRRCLVIVDEAYAEYATAKDFPRALELMRRFPNLVVTRTFSKIYGMAGMRLGYGIGDATLIRQTLRVKTPFNINRLVQVAGMEALKDKGFVGRSLQLNRRGKTQLEKGFQKLGIRFLPTQANFICFETPVIPAVELCENLMRQGMIIRPLKSFSLPNWCRVTIGTQEQNRFFLDRLASCLALSSPPNP